MKELHINLIVTALTLVLVGGIGALAEAFSQDQRYKPGNESLAVKDKMSGHDAPAPLKRVAADGETNPAPDKVTTH